MSRSSNQGRFAPLAQRPWHKLSPRCREMLCHMNACGALLDTDFRDLIWWQPVAPQAVTQTLARWEESRLITRYTHATDRSASPYYQLGRTGARKLREAGIRVIAPTRKVDDRVRTGMLLANTFMVRLWRDLLAFEGIAGVAWSQEPFRGETVRSDGFAAIHYTLDGSPAPGRPPGLFDPAITAIQTVVPPRHGVQWMIIEVDRATETTAQLQARARHWRQAWTQMQPTIPEGVMIFFLWMTTGTWRRAATIWETWIQHARLPLLVTTTRALANPVDGCWHPGHPLRCAPDGQITAVWRDEHGRVRSLIPWLLDEPHLRIQPSTRPTATSFSAACAAWDAQYPLERHCSPELREAGSGPSGLMGG